MDPEKLAADYGSQDRMGQAARPEEVADATLFLISAEASYISGVALPLDGGLIVRWAGDADPNISASPGAFALVFNGAPGCPFRLEKIRSQFPSLRRIELEEWHVDRTLAGNHQMADEEKIFRISRPRA